MVLTFVYEDYFNDGVQRDVNGVRAHAVLGAVWRAIVSVAELFWRYVLDLGQQRGWRWYVRDLVDERYQMVSTRSDWKNQIKLGPKPTDNKHSKFTQESVVGVGREYLFGSIEEEPEGQEDLDVRPLHQHALVDLGRVLQVADTDGVRSRHIADGVQRIENLKRKLSIISLLRFWKLTIII